MLNQLKQLLGNAYVLGTIISVAIISFWYGTQTIQASITPDTPSRNLLSNGSFEQFDDQGNPTNWKITSTNPTYQVYKSKGFIGEHALQLQVTSFENGLVKIETTPIQIKQNSDYYFKMYYLANLDIDLLVRYHFTDGTNKLVWNSVYPAVDEVWSTLSTPIHISDGVKEISFVVQVSDIGYLNLDGAYLIESSRANLPTNVTLTSPNLVPNPAFSDITKQGDPTDWLTYSFGINQHGFKTITEAENTFVRAEMNQYQSGETKWQYLPVAVEGNRYGTFSVDYRSDTKVDLIAEYRDNTEKFLFTQLAELRPTDEWTEFTVDFYTPANVNDVFVALVLHREGFVESDNYNLQFSEESVEFDRPLVSITFDDGWVSQHTDALPILESHSFPATFYINPGTIDKPEYLTTKNLKEIKSMGHQIASHGYRHVDLTTISPSQVERELRQSTTFLSNTLGIDTVDFSTPYGKHDALTNKTYSSIVASNRGTDDGLNNKANFDKYNLRVYFVQQETTPEMIAEHINAAKASNSWLVLVYHQVGTLKVASDIPTELFEEHMEQIKDNDVTVTTVRQALEELTPQLKP